MNHSKFADELLSDFLQHARALGGDVQPVKVLRSNTCRIGNSHVLARIAADTGKYFFGLNYINAEEVANLDNSFVAFVCGDVGSSVIMPMSELRSSFLRSAMTETASLRSTSQKILNWL